VRQTSRLLGKRTYEVLIDVVACYFSGQHPDLRLIF
jgi:hypothetical protein